MTSFVALLAGLAAGAAGGWYARTFAGRREPAAPSPPRPWVRAADAAAGLPVDATLEHLCRVLADVAREAVGMPCAVVLRDNDGGPLKITTISSGDDRRLEGVAVDLDSPAGRAITEATPTVALATEAVVHAGPRDRRRPLRGGVAVPLLFGSRVGGAVLALGEPPMAPAAVVDELEKLARRFGPVLGPAQAVEIAKRQADTDELTGLANRRALKRVMASADAARSALVMLDLDYFKRINDTLGHAAGDAALKHVGSLLKTALRGADVAARIGGEEFAVWLPGGDIGHGMEVAERLRKLLAERPFRFGGQEHPMTLSCGVSASPIPIPSPENLMATADSALYRAKREGRDRCVATKGKGD